MHKLKMLQRFKFIPCFLLFVHLPFVLSLVLAVPVWSTASGRSLARQTGGSQC